MKDDIHVYFALCDTCYAISLLLGNEPGVENVYLENRICQRCTGPARWHTKYLSSRGFRFPTVNYEQETPETPY